jgi:tRNA nucleotidyltransferase/poly(A) polymerase
MRKSKYKSKIIKQRKARLFRELDKVLDEARRSLALKKIQQSAEVEQLLESSPDYAQINDFCLKVASLYEDFAFTAVAFDAANKRLVYTFESAADWSRVKKFYTAWFSQQGWQIIDAGDELPSVDKIAVKASNYKIMLCDMSDLGGYLLSGEKD